MSDKPILFSGPMVRALLAGNKTQTRRALKPQPSVNEAGLLRWTSGTISAQTDAEGLALWMRISIGDRLYVRENFAIAPTTAWALPKMVSADADMAAYYQSDFDRSGKPRWKPSIHMPRWASRITLTVTDVRVQRLHDISEADAIAEGVDLERYVPVSDSAGLHSSGEAEPTDPIEEYRDLWNSINGPGSWDANQYVAAYTFTVALGNIDELPK